MLVRVEGLLGDGEGVDEVVTTSVGADIETVGGDPNALIEAITTGTDDMLGGVADGIGLVRRTGGEVDGLLSGLTSSEVFAISCVGMVMTGEHEVYTILLEYRADEVPHEEVGTPTTDGVDTMVSHDDEEGMVCTLGEHSTKPVLDALEVRIEGIGIEADDSDTGVVDEVGLAHLPRGTIWGIDHGLFPSRTYTERQPPLVLMVARDGDDGRRGCNGSYGLVENVPKPLMGSLDLISDEEPSVHPRIAVVDALYEGGSYLCAPVLQVTNEDEILFGRGLWNLELTRIQFFSPLPLLDVIGIFPC